jgi:adenylate cyclase class 2
MKIEYEATFPNTDKDDVRARLKAAGAVLIKPEILMRRKSFAPPNEKDIKYSWARVRDEGDKITMSFKTIKGDKIEDQKEEMVIIDSFENGVGFLQAMGCREKAYQESKREIWKIDGAEVCLDEWPFLEPYVEVEGESEAAVRAASEKLGFDYSLAKFCCVTALYSEKYNISEDDISNKTPEITFAKNPFLK